MQSSFQQQWTSRRRNCPSKFRRRHRPLFSFFTTVTGWLGTLCSSLNDLVCFVSCRLNVTQPTNPCHHFCFSETRRTTSGATRIHQRVVYSAIQNGLSVHLAGVVTLSFRCFHIFQRSPFFCISQAAGVNGLSSRWQLDQSGDTSVFKPRPCRKIPATVC